MNRYAYQFHEALICPQPFYQMFIRANEDVAPCCTYPSPAIIGNVTNEQLKNIWNGTRHKAFMEMQLTKQKCKNVICRDCINPAEATHPLDNMDGEADKVIQRWN